MGYSIENKIKKYKERERESWRQKHARDFLFSLHLKRDIEEEKGGGGGGERN